MYEGEGKRTECGNDSVVGAGRLVTEGLRAGRGCVDEIFTLKQIGEKARESVCGFYGFGEGVIGVLYGGY